MGDPAAEATRPGLLDRLPGWTVPAILAGVPLLLWLAVQVEPSLYRDVVWRYYWGPIKADAEGASFLEHDGVRAFSGYNVVNTLSWAALLGACILGMAQMLRRLRTPMDARLILGATAWVVAGSVFHVVEDVGTFATPLQYLFITPPIYLLFAAFGVLSFLVGHYLRAVAARAGVGRALQKLWFLHAILVLLWLAFWLKPWGQITAYVNPAWVALFAAVNFLATRLVVVRMGRIDPSTLTLTLSLGANLLAVAYVVSFQLDPWSPHGEGMPLAFLIAPALAVVAVLMARWGPRKALGAAAALILSVFAAVFAAKLAGRLAGALGLSSWRPDFGDVGFVLSLFGVGAAAGLWLAWRFLRAYPSQREAVAAALRDPINLLVVFSQSLDGFATALGIDIKGYSEKHVLSADVIATFRTAAEALGWPFGVENATFLAFVPLKFALSLAVVHVIDVQSREDALRHPTLIGLVKFAIIMVGLGPGVRDFTRLSLGV